MGELEYMHEEIVKQYLVPKGTFGLCAFPFYQYSVPEGTFSVHTYRNCFKQTYNIDKEKSQRDGALVKNPTSATLSPFRDTTLVRETPPSNLSPFRDETYMLNI